MKTTSITMLAMMALLAALAPLSAQERVPVPPVPPVPKTPPLPVVETVSGQQRIDQRRPASADGTVDINSLSGSVRVVGWDRNEVAVTGRLGEGVERLELAGDSSRTVVRVVIPRNARHVEGSDLEVYLPASSRVRAITVGADMNISKVSGTIDLTSVSGDIHVSDNPREVAVNAVSGDVDLSISSSRVRGRTVSGEITIRGAQGEVDVTTVNGEVLVKGGQFERGRFSTVNGKIQFDGDLKPNGVFHFEAVNGTVDLLLPVSVKADFWVSARDINNEFGPEAQAGGYGPPAKRLGFSTGAGGASVTISTMNGSVSLRKKK